MTPLTIKEIALALEISPDTLRNWQRLGVVASVIYCEEIDDLKRILIAQGRLSSRANKLYKVSETVKPSHWSKYEQSLEDSHRNREGIYYTPQSIVEDIFSTIPQRDGLEDKIFLDPCCGSGNFLVEALNMGFRPENIYGYDTDSKAVAIAKKRVKGAHISRGDFLDIAQRITTKFDYIYTNPPWGKRLDMEQRKRVTAYYGTPRSADSTALFIVASQRLLKEGGKMGFLVQEAVFNIGTFEWLRERLLKLKLECIKDYGRPFRSLVTRAQGFVAENREVQKGEQCWCNYGNGCHLRRIDYFGRISKSVINFWADADDMECMEAIYNMPHKILKGSARWGMGIVTGDNKNLCSPTPIEGREVGVVKGSDIHKEGVLPPSTFIGRDLERFQQAAPREIYEAEVKLIYKFISKRLMFFADREQRYLLNSANCVVVDDNFGLTCEQIAELLNSDVINWIFETLFRSHKILRGDIEVLPIHIDYFAEYDTFSEDNYCKYLGVERQEGGGYRLMVNADNG